GRVVALGHPADGGAVVLGEGLPPHLLDGLVAAQDGRVQLGRVPLPVAGHPPARTLGLVPHEPSSGGSTRNSLRSFSNPSRIRARVAPRRFRRVSRKPVRRSTVSSWAAETAAPGTCSAGTSRSR